MTARHRLTFRLTPTLETLERALGVLRRRQLVVERLVMESPASGGLAQATLDCSADGADVSRAVVQLAKVIGIEAARAVPVPATQDASPQPKDATS